MTIQTPNNVHAAAVIQVDQSGVTETMQLLNSNNIASLAYLPGSFAEFALLEMVQPIGPANAILALTFGPEIAAEPTIWIAPLLVPVDPIFDDAPDGSIICNKAMSIEIGTFSLAVWEINSEPGPTVVSDFQP